MTHLHWEPGTGAGLCGASHISKACWRFLIFFEWPQMHPFFFLFFFVCKVTFVAGGSWTGNWLFGSKSVEGPDITIIVCIEWLQNTDCCWQVWTLLFGMFPEYQYMACSCWFTWLLYLYYVVFLICEWFALAPSTIVKCKWIDVIAFEACYTPNK